MNSQPKIKFVPTDAAAQIAMIGERNAVMISSDGSIAVKSNVTTTPRVEDMTIFIVAAAENVKQDEAFSAHLSSLLSDMASDEAQLDLDFGTKPTANNVDSLEGCIAAARDYCNRDDISDTASAAFLLEFFMIMRSDMMKSKPFIDFVDDLYDTLIGEDNLSAFQRLGTPKLLDILKILNDTFLLGEFTEERAGRCAAHETFGESLISEGVLDRFRQNGFRTPHAGASTSTDKCEDDSGQPERAGPTTTVRGTGIMRRQDVRNVDILSDANAYRVMPAGPGPQKIDGIMIGINFYERRNDIKVDI